MITTKGLPPNVREHKIRCDKNLCDKIRGETGGVVAIERVVCGVAEVVAVKRNWNHCRPDCGGWWSGHGERRGSKTVF